VPRKSPYIIELSEQERDLLEAQARRYTLPYRDVIQAKIVLMAAAGLDNDEIAARLDTRREVVSKWRKRFYLQHLAGLEERPRRGRPPTFPPEVAIQVKAIACELPSRLGLPLSRLFVPDIRAEVIACGLVEDLGDPVLTLSRVRLSLSAALATRVSDRAAVPTGTSAQPANSKEIATRPDG